MDGKVFDASMTKFQSPRSGKFVSDAINEKLQKKLNTFQSPRSGKFVSDKMKQVRLTDITNIVSIP